MRKAPVFMTSVGGGVFGESLVRELTARGAASTLDYSIPLEEYWSGKSGQSRLRLRAKMYAGYPIGILGRCLREKGRFYVATSNPFFLPAVVGGVRRLRGHRVVQWLYDLYPDALIVGGALRSGGLAARLLAVITRAGFRQTDATVFLGERLADHAEQAYSKARRRYVIPVGSDGSAFRDVEASLRRQDSVPLDAPVTMLYSGSFGRMHDATTLEGALAMLSSGLAPHGPGAGSSGAAQLRIRFQASGPGVRRLADGLSKRSGSGVAFVENGRRVQIQWDVEFGPNLEQDAWVSLMQSVPVALVTMAPGAEKVVMPSKTYSAMLAGQAILAVAPLDSDLADTVLRHECGWVVIPEGLPKPPGLSGAAGRVFHGSSGLASVLAIIASDPAGLLKCRRNAAEAGMKHYSIEAVAGQWMDLFNELA